MTPFAGWHSNYDMKISTPLPNQKHKPGPHKLSYADEEYKGHKIIFKGTMSGNVKCYIDDLGGPTFVRQTKEKALKSAKYMIDSFEEDNIDEGNYHMRSEVPIDPTG